MPHARRILGDAGERLAERALLARGWTVLERNARTRYGEIDLVCRDGEGIVFVEVKTRRSSSFVPAVEAVTAHKLYRVTRLGEAWLALRGLRDSAWRPVVVAVTVGGGGAEVEVLEPA